MFHTVFPDLHASSVFPTILEIAKIAGSKLISKDRLARNSPINKLPLLSVSVTENALALPMLFSIFELSYVFSAMVPFIDTRAVGFSVFEFSEVAISVCKSLFNFIFMADFKVN
jgi:hypothetical protein